MMHETAELVEKLVGKSIEAFTMAVEIYNKPTIHYRVEGFSFFICNAWELMLKAHLINLGKDIYYKNNNNRTKSLELCVREVFTNDKDPARLNLEKIIDLRNTSTHFITEEYEMIYVPLFQANIFNYSHSLEEYHKRDITNYIPQCFLTLQITPKSLNETEIRSKYPVEIANKLIDKNRKIIPMIESNNQAFAIRIEQTYYLTKNKEKADAIVRIDNNSAFAENIKIVRELKDPNQTHKYTQKTAIEEINRRIILSKIETKKLTSFGFQLFIKVYKLKDDERYCYVHTQFSAKQYTYSIHVIELIVEAITRAPLGYEDELKAKLTALKSEQKK